MRTQYILLFISLVLFSGCSNPSEDLFNEVMAVHDEVMPKMDDIMKEKGRIQEMINSENDSARIIMLRETISNLNSADESMMEWMRSFDRDKFSEDPDAQINYYREELIRINEVKEKMLTAINESKAVQ
ncbi:hypothetical protein [Fulvivirga sedimenti]|uniref:Viral A-type inclusion protein n=1 Tax=Fulvivirga sedimenti TaxID=2879465 RepID=A0A9X1KX72_9BACT|nr:hypothetical protein [Fulvivirga sedimenti]MCA6075476.1 hypothetical protein [Fulvivirga sedimenti]MCA6076653.1 hypothetical protein [Fulvivirga sedimenti]MCA6077781.1 hypothetical protein [Fulvivirga sedimenti]